MERETNPARQETAKPEETAIESSWLIENLETISQKIIWKQELTELTNESNIENSFMMSQPPMENPIPCSLKISLKNNRKFSGLQILSEVTPPNLTNKLTNHYL